MKELEKEFYAYLGLLSAQFAKMEYKLSVILGHLLGNEEELITLTLIENNTLHQNLELLKKLNKIRDIYPKTISQLNDEIQNIKSERNLFIHGIWLEPHEPKKGIKNYACEERKLKYTEERNKAGIVTSVKWSHNDHYFYDTDDFKKRIKKIGEIIKIEDVLIKKLESKDSR